MTPGTESPAARRDGVGDVISRLDVLQRLAVMSGNTAIVAEVSQLTERVAEGRFFVACVGQFKRGKSTLLNALVGRQILPTGVVPVTTAVTVVRHGPTPAARVHFLDGHDAPIQPDHIAEYVAEQQNPGNEKGVVTVEVELPSELLASGMCLVDTPGLGSVFAANTEATRAFLPHIDAALVVLGADPPISSEELIIVGEVARQVSHLVFVVNKADRLSEEETREAAAFARRVVSKRLDRPVGEFLLVSAAERSSGIVSRDWPQLETALRDLNRQASAVVSAAATRGLRRLGRQLLIDLAARREALATPLEESERRLRELRAAASAAGDLMRDLSARFGVEQAELSAAFREIREAFLAGALPSAQQRLARALAEERARNGPATRSRAMEIAMEVANDAVRGWVREVEPKAEAMYQRAMGRFVQLANEFVARLGAGAAAFADVDEVPDESGFRTRGDFFFTSMLTLTTAGPVAWLLDRLVPGGLRRPAIDRAAAQYLERLMATNSARVANDLSERVLESRRRLEDDIRRRLRALVEIAERAMANARAQLAAGEDAVRSELARIDTLETEIASVLGARD
jgi:GTP-binding protein EngB required for normal cell division